MSRLPGRFAVLCCVAAADLGLRVLGFRRVMHLVNRLSGTGEHVALDTAQAEQYAQLVASAAALYPGRALCLEQSLVLYVLLRRRGQPVELRFGVRPYPFLAHAWVELCGAPLNERADEVSQLAMFSGKVS